MKETPTAFPWTHDNMTCTGMTLRDYFAAKAMQAILPTYNTVDVFNDQTGDDDDPSFPELIAIDSYVMADAMLKAREA